MAAMDCPWLCGGWHHPFLAKLTMKGPLQPSNLQNRAHLMATVSCRPPSGGQLRPLQRACIYITLVITICWTEVECSIYVDYTNLHYGLCSPWYSPPTPNGPKHCISNLKFDIASSWTTCNIMNSFLHLNYISRSKIWKRKNIKLELAIHNILDSTWMIFF